METFEIVRLAEFTARTGISEVVAALQNWLKAEIQSAQGLVDEAAVTEAKLAYSQAVAAAGAFVDEQPHLRVRDGFDRRGHPAVVASFLLDGLWVQRASPPLPQAGFCGGTWEAMYAAMDIVSNRLGRLGHERAFQLMGGRSGTVPDYFWLDTGVRPEI